MVKNALLSKCVVTKCCEIGDGVIGVKLQNKLSLYEIVVFSVYLPLDGSRYSHTNENILAKLAIELYRHNEVDQIFLCGDFNARIGSLDDVEISPNLPERRVIDATVNAQGHKLIEFISDIKGCVINGCITPTKDYFTSVARHKGKAVVDYHITRTSDICNVLDMEVKTSLE